jgi:hypothetical protein
LRWWRPSSCPCSRRPPRPSVSAAQASSGWGRPVPRLAMSAAAAPSLCHASAVPRSRRWGTLPHDLPSSSRRSHRSSLQRDTGAGRPWRPGRAPAMAVQWCRGQGRRARAPGRARPWRRLGLPPPLRPAPAFSLPRGKLCRRRAARGGDVARHGVVAGVLARHTRSDLTNLTTYRILTGVHVRLPDSGPVYLKLRSDTNLRNPWLLVREPVDFRKNYQNRYQRVTRARIVVVLCN